MDNRALFCKNVEDALDQELTERYGEDHEINGMPKTDDFDRKNSGSVREAQQYR